MSSVHPTAGVAAPGSAPLALALALALLAPATVQATVSLELLGTYETGIFDGSAAEIPAYDPANNRLFVTNSEDNTLDVLKIDGAGVPSLETQIDLSPYGNGPNSVAVGRGMVAVAVEADPSQAPGSVVFFNLASLAHVNTLRVGALPDMLTFSPDENLVVVANEGEPNDDYNVDPEGSVSIIDVSAGAGSLTDADVLTADFNAFDSQVDALRSAGVRIFGPGASVSQDLEPEYVAVSADSSTAWVACQENNALAVVDLGSATVTAVIPLGFKNHQAKPNALDASNRDGGYKLRNWPVKGMYQPDAIDAAVIGGQEWIFSANEGDARDYDGFSEEVRVKDLFDPEEEGAVPGGQLKKDASLLEDENLGRLRVTSAPPAGKVTRNDGTVVFNQLYSYGARSFSVWTADGQLAWDSGSAFEEITFAALGDDFNSTNDENDSGDDRSDDKGPEPEAIVVAPLDGGWYAFIGLERVGGIMVWDVSSPTSPQFSSYFNARDFSGDAEAGTAGDLGPEGLVFVPAADSPTGGALLVATNEVSGTTSVFAVTKD